MRMKKILLIVAFDDAYDELGSFAWPFGKNKNFNRSLFKCNSFQ